MVSEFDLPCTACGHELAAATVPAGRGKRASAAAGTDSVTVAECRNCGTRHYPESALEGVGFRQ